MISISMIVVINWIMSSIMEEISKHAMSLSMNTRNGSIHVINIRDHMNIASISLVWIKFTNLL